MKINVKIHQQNNQNLLFLQNTHLYNLACTALHCRPDSTFKLMHRNYAKSMGNFEHQHVTFAMLLLNEHHA